MEDWVTRRSSTRVSSRTKSDGEILSSHHNGAQLANSKIIVDVQSTEYKHRAHKTHQSSAIKNDRYDGYDGSIIGMLHMHERLHAQSTMTGMLS